MVLMEFLAAGRLLNYEPDTDVIDRLHSFVTSNLLIAFAVLVSFKQFGGRPIECMPPDTFNDAMEQYTESYCWQRDTYFLPFDKEVPLTEQGRKDAEISYYQWVPFFLLMQAFCFRVPNIIWSYLASHSGIRLRDILRLASDSANVKKADRDANLQALCAHLQNALRFHRRLKGRNLRLQHKKAICLNVPYTAFYVTSLYLVIKLLNMLNVVLQLYIMNRFLMTNSEGSFLGYRTFYNMINGTGWEMSGAFPRVTLCDVQARVLGSVQLYTVQCVLVINLFTEKIYMFLWLWFVLVMLLTMVSFLYWLIVGTFPYYERRFIKRHLKLADMPYDSKGVIFANDLVKLLWERFTRIDEIVEKAFTDEKMVKFSSAGLNQTHEHSCGVQTQKSILKSATTNHKSAIDQPDSSGGNLNNETSAEIRRRWQKGMEYANKNLTDVKYEKLEMNSKSVGITMPVPQESTETVQSDDDDQYATARVKLMSTDT